MTARRDGHFWTRLTIGLGLMLIVAAWVLEGAQQSERPGCRWRTAMNQGSET